MIVLNKEIKIKFIFWIPFIGIIFFLNEYKKFKNTLTQKEIDSPNIITEGYKKNIFLGIYVSIFALIFYLFYIVLPISFILHIRIREFEIKYSAYKQKGYSTPGEYRRAIQQGKDVLV